MANTKILQELQNLAIYDNTKNKKQPLVTGVVFYKRKEPLIGSFELRIAGSMKKINYIKRWLLKFVYSATV